jgi:hypothetical protein
MTDDEADDELTGELVGRFMRVSGLNSNRLSILVA